MDFLPRVRHSQWTVEENGYPCLCYTSGGLASPNSAKEPAQENERSALSLNVTDLAASERNGEEDGRHHKA